MTYNLVRRVVCIIMNLIEQLVRFALHPAGNVLHACNMGDWNMVWTEAHLVYIAASKEPYLVKDTCEILPSS